MKRATASLLAAVAAASLAFAPGCDEQAEVRSPRLRLAFGAPDRVVFTMVRTGEDGRSDALAAEMALSAEKVASLVAKVEAFAGAPPGQVEIDLSPRLLRPGQTVTCARLAELVDHVRGAMSAASIAFVQDSDRPSLALADPPEAGSLLAVELTAEGKLRAGLLQEVTAERLQHAWTSASQQDAEMPRHAMFWCHADAPLESLRAALTATGAAGIERVSVRLSR